MNQFSNKEQNTPPGLRLRKIVAHALLLGLLFVSAPHRQTAASGGRQFNRQSALVETAAPLPIQISSAQVRAECPAGCRIPITITGIQNINSNEGRKVKVDWTVGQIPGDLKVSGVSIFAEVTLENDKVLDGSSFVSLSTTSATVAVKGGLLNLNKGKRDDAKRIKVTVSVISNLKEELARPRNVSSRFSADGRGMDVTWEFTKLPCDTATEFEVEVTLKPNNLLSDDHAIERVPISARKAFVRLRGLKLRPGVRDSEEQVRPVGRSSIICSASRTFNLPGSN